MALSNQDGSRSIHFNPTYIWHTNSEIVAHTRLTPFQLFGKNSMEFSGPSSAVFARQLTFSTELPGCPVMRSPRPARLRLLHEIGPWMSALVECTVAN